jgi:hypothetical protein
VAALLFVTGLGLQTWLWLRAWVWWDQILLLRLGMRLVVDGELTLFGKIMSGGGLIPGSLLQLLIAGPLAVWFDYRSPGLLLGFSQAVGGLLLWRVAKGMGGPRLGAVYLAVYWLSPWRLYHSGFIWEPSYLLLPAALHLWALWTQRERARFGPSAVLGAVLLASPQIHVSGIVLFFATAFFWWRARPSLSIGGLASGAALGAASLLPTVLGRFQGLWPEIETSGFPGAGFVQVFPVLKGASYWFRIASLDVGRRLRQVVLPEDGALGLGIGLLEVITVASVLVTLVAAFRFLRPGRHDDRLPEPANTFGRRYVGACFVALVVSAGLSPATIQGWHTLVVLHAACLPVALWVHDALLRRSAGPSWAVWAAAAFLALRVPVVLVLGFGHPMYRLPHDPAQLERVAPENLPDIDLQQAPFGARAGRTGPPIPSYRVFDNPR